LAITQGGEVIGTELVSTKDGMLIARHDVTLSASTNVADVPAFADRMRAGENGDGAAVAADWFVCDFTLAEIKTLRARSPNHPSASGFDNQFVIVTLQEIFNLAAETLRNSGRTVTVYPELRFPIYHANLFVNGAIPVRMEDTLVRMARDHVFNSLDAPFLVRSFEPTSLRYMRGIGSQFRQV
jgi:glycerophosphoryl diester phosphodiesterase